MSPRLDAASYNASKTLHRSMSLLCLVHVGTLCDSTSTNLPAADCKLSWKVLTIFKITKFKVRVAKNFYDLWFEKYMSCRAGTELSKRRSAVTTLSSIHQRRRESLLRLVKSSCTAVEAACFARSLLPSEAVRALQQVLEVRLHAHGVQQSGCKSWWPLAC